MSNWTQSRLVALRARKANYLIRPAVREEPLCTAASARGAAPIPLSAWRGVSGRRYVVVIHPLDAPDLVAARAAVVLAVMRDEGRARLIATRACTAGDPGFLGWLAACARLGAGELHAHRLCRYDDERAAIAADLIDPIAAQASGATR